MEEITKDTVGRDYTFKVIDENLSYNIRSTRESTFAFLLRKYDNGFRVANIHMQNTYGLKAVKK